MSVESQLADLTDQTTALMAAVNLRIAALNSAIASVNATAADLTTRYSQVVTYVQLLALIGMHQGDRAFVTDLGINGSSWVYNGVKWVPVGGSIIIARGTGSLAAPLASLSGVTSGAFSLAGGNPKIPAPLLSTGSRIRVNAMGRKNGANSTWGLAARLGTNNSSSDNTLFPAATQTNADNRQQWIFVEAVVYSSTAYTSTGANAANGSGTTAADRTSNFSTTADNYLGFYISAASASDSFDLAWYEVEVRP